MIGNLFVRFTGESWKMASGDNRVRKKFVSLLLKKENNTIKVLIRTDIKNFPSCAYSAVVTKAPAILLGSC